MNFEQAKKEIENILDSVELNDNYKPQALENLDQKRKEMHNPIDVRWSPRTGYCNPIQQVSSRLINNYM